MRIDGAGAGPQWPERARGAGKPATTEGAPAPETTAQPDPLPPESPPAHGVRRLLEAGHFDGKSNESMLAERFGVVITPPIDPAVDAPPIDEAPAIEDTPPSDQAPSEEPPVVDSPVDDAPPIEEPPSASIPEPIVDTNLTEELIDALVEGSSEEPAAA